MNLASLATMVLLLILLVAGCTNDVVSSSHATLADASEDIRRGWIPAALPKSAVEIRETHSVDTNIGHGNFSFGPIGTDNFRAQLTPVPAGQTLRVAGIPRRELEQQGYTFYTYRYFDIAVNWQARLGRFWLTYSQGQA